LFKNDNALEVELASKMSLTGNLIY